MTIQALIQSIWPDPSDERRLHPRKGDPWLRIETQGFAYIARDWSVGGASIAQFHDAGPVGTLIHGEAGWASSDTLFPFMASILRKHPGRTTALRWLDATPEFLGTLDHTARHN